MKSPLQRLIEHKAKEFERNMKKLRKIGDMEDRHRAMDNLMCETLKSLGFGFGVEIFRSTAKWYS